MMEKIRYFDHAATTSTKEEVLKEMIPYFTLNYGNASSIYSIGRKSKKAVEDSRDKIAKAINADSKEIYFTACGSESDNLAIKGVAYANKERGNHIITTKIEHPAVLNTCKKLETQGFIVTYLNVNEDGLISLKELEEAITDKTILISIMFANNEIGTIQPIKEIGEIAKTHKIYFHTDAVQAIGNIRIDVKELNIDLLSMSAHKFYGPKGMGALYVKTGIKFEKIQDGGHQERNKRAGTENVAGIVGIGKAIELAYENFDEYNEKLTELRDYYISQVEEKIPYIKINGHRQKRLPGNANISFKFIEGEGLLLNLDMKGICASSGSACTSGSLDPSHVLLAIGLPHEIAHGSLRITFGDDNTKEDVDFLVNTLVEVVERLRNMSPLYEDFIKNR
ncbi:MAG: cysteine desulfurase NifS [Clostridia bacterium]|nr:cysteine desulfurase NifS [Clostridia bacterium]